jgi:hypothetical protein
MPNPFTVIPGFANHWRTTSARWRGPSNPISRLVLARGTGLHEDAFVPLLWGLTLVLGSHDSNRSRLAPCTVALGGHDHDAMSRAYTNERAELAQRHLLQLDARSVQVALHLHIRGIASPD